MGRGDVHTVFWWWNLRERDHLKDPGVDSRNIKMDLQEAGRRAWTGVICLRIETSGGRL
jgi:hypothetical protein